MIDANWNYDKEREKIKHISEKMDETALDFFGMMESFEKIKEDFNYDYSTHSLEHLAIELLKVTELKLINETIAGLER